MLTYNEANQCRLALKMKLFSYSWYDSSEVRSYKDGWIVTILVKEINKKVKRYIPKKIKDVSIIIELA
jgi:hypothetical protein